MYRGLGRAKGAEEGRSQLVVASAASLAGAPFNETLARLRPVRLQSIPQGIHLFSDWIEPEDGMMQVERIVAAGGWDAVVAAHAIRAREISARYFRGRDGTPAFVLSDRENPGREPYLFYGYQRPDPFLDYMKIGER